MPEIGDIAPGVLLVPLPEALPRNTARCGGECGENGSFGGGA